MNILVEERMNYNLTPSLKHIALVKTTTTLWNQYDIVALVAKCSFSYYHSEMRKNWQEIEDNVLEKVPQLPQPEPLKKEILAFINPIGKQILKWMEFHRNLLGGGYVKENLSRLCWTPQGTVDKKKTAEELIKDANLDITIRYRLACINCLEDDVRALWNSLPASKKAAFYNKRYPSFSKEHELVVIWTYNVKGEVAKLNSLIKENEGKEISPYQFAFEYAVNNGNKVATEYFFQKLTVCEREESLVKYAGYRSAFPKEFCTDVLCFFLSQMNEEQQVKVFERYPCEVLKRFLDWPWQSFFIETANRIWDFLSKEDFNLLLTIIVGKVIDGCKDCNYQTLFGEFWLQSSTTHKEYVIKTKNCGLTLLLNLFELKDQKNISLILKYATLAHKESIIFHFTGMNICEDLAYGNEWDLLKVFMNECIPSQGKMIEFKEAFRKRIESRCSKELLEEEKDRWNEFFQILDDRIKKDDKKRGVVEGNCSPAKRTCNSISEQL